MSQIFLHNLDVIPTLDRSYSKIMEASYRMPQFDHDSFKAVVYCTV